MGSSTSAVNEQDAIQRLKHRHTVREVLRPIWETFQTNNYDLSYISDFISGYARELDASDLDLYDSLHEKYVVRRKQLGKGTFSAVHKGVRKEDKKRVAVKIIKKRFVIRTVKTEEERKELIVDAIKCKLCDHANIVKLYDIRASKSFIFICMEYLPGKDLLEYMNERGRPIRSMMCSHYMKQILSGIKYLHENSIIHGDIKPENLLLSADRQTIKLSDCRLAKYTMVEAEIWNLRCDMNHLAPEVLMKNEYGPQMDVWSTGVILWVMLSVTYPFSDDNRHKVLQKIQSEEINFKDDPIWETAPIAAKDLINLMLIKDPSQRICVENCLAHQYINGDGIKRRPVRGYTSGGKPVRQVADRYFLH